MLRVGAGNHPIDPGAAELSATDQAIHAATVTELLGQRMLVRPPAAPPPP